MNIRAVIHIWGRILLVEAALMLPSLCIALYRGEDPSGFLWAMTLLLLAGGASMLLKPGNRAIYAREGFVIVALSWVSLSLAGALPFWITRVIPGFTQAFFETVSGFTTTGASILTDVEALPRGLLFWRSFTHWVGGMGVLVFMLAVLPMSNERSMFLMRAEVPGPVKAKLAPRMRTTAMILYGIYILMTLLEVVLLLLGGMELFDALTTSFGTAGTGGFSVRNASIAYYQSPYIDIVVSVFMMLFGVNFNVYYLLLLGQWKDAIKNEELRWYLGIILTAVLIIAWNITSIVGSFTEGLRYSFFQVTSIMTTTGFSTAPFHRWPTLSKAMLVALMLIGACAGSTGGGLKVSRVVLLLKSSGRELRRLLQPRAVRVVRMDGLAQDNRVLHSTAVFFFLYMLLLFFSTLVVALDGQDLETSFTAVVACISNIGPGLGQVNPMSNYSLFSNPVQWVLCLDMLLGRLEIYPILMLFSPTTWRRR